MRIVALLACTVLLASCSRVIAPLPYSNTTPNGVSGNPDTGPWLCGQPPSAARDKSVEPLLGTTYKSLYKFKAGSDGGYPYGALVSFRGKLYGTTDQGGTGGYGTVFEVTTSGQEHVLYSFKGGTDGGYPCAGLTQVNGKFFGTTSSGGAHGWGTVFDVTPAGQEHVIYSFRAGRDGAAPYAGLAYLHGKFYGTTVEGGTAGWGTIFETTATGPVRVLYDFKAGKKDGAYPYGGITTFNGTLFGTTMQGGSLGWGTAFSASTSGKERMLYSFKAGKDGGYPFDGLTSSANGKLFGTTRYGGSAGYGTVFSLTTSGQEHVVYSFKSGSDGAYPYARLLAFNGSLYGVTIEGGSAQNWGTAFAVDAAGTERVLYRFKAGRDGAYPFARLTELNGHLYGTTQGGGINGGWGTVFSVTP